MISFASFANLEQATAALVTDYRRQKQELRRVYKNLERELLRGAPRPGRVMALGALRRQHRAVRRQLRVEVWEKLAAADLWAFEDPNCESE